MGTVLEVFIVPPEGSDECQEIFEKASEVIDAKAIKAVVVYPKGTASGASSVAVLVELPNGAIVHAETTAALWLTAAGAVKGAVERAGG